MCVLGDFLIIFFVLSNGFIKNLSIFFHFTTQKKFHQNETVVFFYQIIAV